MLFELMGYREVEDLGSRLELLKCVQTTRAESEVPCFKFYLDSPEVAKFFVLKGSTYFSKWKFDHVGDAILPLLPSDELNVPWHFSATISNIGASIGNLKKPFLIDNDLESDSNFLFNVPLTITNLDSQPETSRELCEEQCDQLLNLTCKETGCKPEEVTILVGRPNLPNPKSSSSDTPKGYLVNRFNVQKFLTTLGCYVASVYCTKKFECNIKSVKSRIFRSKALTEIGATSSKLQAVVSLIEAAFRISNELDWREVVMDGFKSDIDARDIKAKVVRYATKIETDFHLTKPFGEPFYGEKVIITAPLETARAIYSSEHLFMLMEEENVHHLPLEFVMDRMEDEKPKTPYILIQLEKSLKELRRVAGRRRRSGPSDSQRSTETDRGTDTPYYPRNLRDRDEGYTANSLDPTPSESRDLKNKEKREKNKKAARRKSKSKNQSSMEIDDLGEEETKSSSSPNSSVTSSVWNGSSGRGNSSNRPPIDEKSLEDRLLKKLEEKLESAIDKKLGSLLDKMMNKMTDVIGAKIEQALGRMMPGAFPLSPPTTMSFQNIPPPMNFQPMPFPNMGPTNMVPPPNCGPPQTFTSNTTPQSQTVDSEIMSV